MQDNQLIKIQNIPINGAPKIPKNLPNKEMYKKPNKGNIIVKKLGL